MKLFIPTIGTKLQLTAAWFFDLHHEYRNESMFEAMGFRYIDPHQWRRDHDWADTEPPAARTLLARGTDLTVDRIYIRKGAGDFDSISFFLTGAKTKTRHEEQTGRSVRVVSPGISYPSGGGMPPKTVSTPFTYKRTRPARQVRFWVKLSDVNGMSVKVL